jgi:hypothetical protein
MLALQQERSSTALCQCGCGQPAPIATLTDRAAGRVKGEPCRFVHRHNGRGPRNSPETLERQRRSKRAERNPQWKGGRLTHSEGYVRIRASVGIHDFEHRLVMPRCDPIQESSAPRRLNRLPAASDDTSRPAARIQRAARSCAASSSGE